VPWSAQYHPVYLPFEDGPNGKEPSESTQPRHRYFAEILSWFFLRKEPAPLPIESALATATGTDHP
jgi:hypothetical protein